jgi:hypothetical protein
MIRSFLPTQNLDLKMALWSDFSLFSDNIDSREYIFVALHLIFRPLCGFLQSHSPGDGLGREWLPVVPNEGLQIGETSKPPSEFCLKTSWFRSELVGASPG